MPSEGASFCKKLNIWKLCKKNFRDFAIFYSKREKFFFKLLSSIYKIPFRIEWISLEKSSLFSVEKSEPYRDLTSKGICV